MTFYLNPFWRAVWTDYTNFDYFPTISGVFPVRGWDIRFQGSIGRHNPDDWNFGANEMFQWRKSRSLTNPVCFSSLQVAEKTRSMSWSTGMQKLFPTIASKSVTNCDISSRMNSLQWWPIETDRQKRFLLCISSHWDYENKQMYRKKTL